MEETKDFKDDVENIMRENNIKDFLILNSKPLPMGEYMVVPTSVSWIENGKLQANIQNLIIKNKEE